MNQARVNLQAGELDPAGFCMASDERHAIFGALPGEDVLAAPIKKRGGKVFCRTEDVGRAHADRVTPRCSAAAFCGGCSLQHIAPEAQRSYKEARLKELFTLVEPDVWLPTLSADEYHYRSKARLGVKYVEKKGRVLVGFRETMKPYIAETESCHVLRKPVGELITPLARLIETLDQARSVPQVEVAVGDDVTALVFRHLQAMSEHDADALIRFGQSHQVDIYLQPGSPDSVHKIWPNDDLPRLSYDLMGLSISFHPLDFTQVNAAINRNMVADAIQYLALTPDDRVLDAFCGIGNFSLPVAQRTYWVHGIELSETSVERAVENAKANGVTNTSFEAGDLFSEDYPLDLAQYSKVLIDPPRLGAEALCRQLASSQVEKVVYVSCKPETLTRDVSLLIAGGFRLDKLGVIDMFPHTIHMEAMAVLTRADHG